MKIATPHRLEPNVLELFYRGGERIDEAQPVAFAPAGQALARMVGERAREGLVVAVGHAREQGVDLAAGDAM